MWPSEEQPSPETAPNPPPRGTAPGDAARQDQPEPGDDTPTSAAAGKAAAADDEYEPL